MRLMTMSSLFSLHFIVFLLVNQCHSREITHEDIKDAMLSLVHMMREDTEKLERHEVRERQLGEQMKKAISLLSKRVSSVDGIKTHLTKLDERIGSIEQLISQRNERERIQIQKTSDAIELLDGRLDNWMHELDNKLSKINSRIDNTKQMGSDDKCSENLPSLVRTQETVEATVFRIVNILEDMWSQFKINIPDEKEKMLMMSTEVNNIAKKISDIEASLATLNNNTQELNAQIKYKTIVPNPILEHQNMELIKLQEMMNSISNHLERIPQMTELASLDNKTLIALDETAHELQNIIVREIADISKKVDESRNASRDSVGELRLDLANNAERVNQELQDLNRGQSVMVSMADHVLDTKKRVEYGVHQILLEVGDLIKGQGLVINDTLNTRFNDIFNGITDNQNGALANLTTKMEQEMNQVWRQINVMYQQMSESAKALEKIHKQNEIYVNGTTSSMDGMESKVGEITKRMSEMDENLNYLLGRLSLVTQEFNQIKTGLGSALDNIKSSFKELQKQANDLSSPGPHPVPENYKDLDEAPVKNMPEILSPPKSY
ncbi:hypothetical protein PV327_003712 [Microctonus hyperodae]|uniref:Uncharacterized protein n=1 Tax=Microctonus hyperodae TaxID=165561 RepID=A0AA39G4J5_MICHY|nr:hypothetical protein PV327_003712 [Microctonus hyperodae]